LHGTAWELLGAFLLESSALESGQVKSSEGRKYWLGSGGFIQISRLVAIQPYQRIRALKYNASTKQRLCATLLGEWDLRNGPFKGTGGNLGMDTANSK